MNEIWTWRGTEDEVRELLAAIDNNCACPAEGPETCGAHSLLADARSLDHLLYVYRTGERFVRAEQFAELDPASSFWGELPQEQERS